MAQFLLFRNITCLNNPFLKISSTFIKEISFQNKRLLFSLKSSKSFKEKKYKSKDKINNEYELIYKAPMENYLSFAKNFTTLSSLVAGTGFGWRYINGLQLVELSKQIEYGVLTSTELEMQILCLGFFGMAAVIRIFMNRYPLRIYKYNENYIAIFGGQLPFSYKQIPFKKGEVTEMEETGVLPWKESRYKINTNRVLLLINYFKTPSELYAMLIKTDK